MTEWAFTAAIALATISLLASAFYGLHVARVRGGSRRSWHLLVAAPRYLDLSQYAPKAVELSVSFRRCGLFALGCLIVAAIIRLLAAV
jgi:hypothetical protein